MNKEDKIYGNNFKKFYPDQIMALYEIENFLKSKEDKIFFFKGSSNRGKNYLIDEIKEIVRKIELIK